MGPVGARLLFGPGVPMALTPPVAESLLLFKNAPARQLNALLLFNG